MKQKYDYSALHVEFLKSEFDEVKSFITHKWLIYSAERARRTKWRTKEKQELKKKIVERALEKNLEKQSSDLQVPLEDLMKWKKILLQALLVQAQKSAKKIYKEEEWDLESTATADKILKTIKTELGEPNTIWANYNMNANKVEWLTDEESEALDVLFWSKLWKKMKQ